MSNLTMDVIALCAFGTKIDTYGEKRSDFLTYAQKIVNPSVRVWVLFLIVVQFPNFLKWTGLSLMDPGACRFFQAAVRSIISRRQADQVKHNDYLQLMLNAQNKTLDTSDEPDIDGDKSEQIYGPIDANKNPIANKVKMDVTEVDVLASSFIFFAAGYETTGSLLTFLFYRLALNEKCQRRLYEEVSRFDGDYSYENLVKMTYLEACIAETLRLYNPLVFNERIAAEDYKLGDTGITIPKGTFVDIDVWSIHHNPEYYPNPDRWDPERFMPENRDQLVPYTYMPFGLGPRNCVGMRFALMEAKTAAAHLVNKFEFSRTTDTPTELKPQKMQFLLNCGEIKVGIKSRK
ncbi:unnamed protein product [Oppiella nova]|uniref:Cytochrome P450 n=1 Tax=Oppiella nova TaxID=334625 RepID=A0A7R9QW53_9ACAR|nr:unnamed protein product [Oppiella nova]CAG2177263.1 unnamed protein product [Oppiella nova]